jgi:hypothetical protein
VNPPPSFTPIRVNSAGAAYTDSQGQVWSVDTGFTGGSAATPSGTVDILNTTDDTLYRSERWGAFNYSFAVPAGNYAVTLKFAETYFSSVGQRLFNVAINGTTVLSNFDIVAAAGGANTAVDRTFTVSATTGNITIQFIHVTGQPDDPKVDAIQIVSSSGSPPTITTQPASQTVTEGQTATFTVVATGSPAPSYQWQKGGVNIAGATSSSYTTPPTVAGDDGSTFDVVVSNTAGSVTSNTATLTVNPPVAPTITTQPTNQTVTEGQTATFTVVATGSPAPSYQWQKGGVNIGGATSSSYTTPPTVAGDDGSTFDVVVSNTAASVTSNTATLTVNPLSVTVLSVSPTSVTGGASSTGTVTLNGAAPAAGIVVVLSAHPSFASLPSSVTVAAGQATATFAITTTQVKSSKSVTISAKLNGATVSTTLTITP